MNKFKGELLLLLAALVWGTAFVFQKLGADGLPAFTFNACKFAIGTVALIPLMLLLDRRDEKKGISTSGKMNRTLVTASLICGCTQFLASFFQQYGIAFTTAGKAGFITQMNIVFIPVILIFMKKKVSRITWLGVALAVVGLYLLSITDGFHIQKGDALVLACALMYAIQILIIDYYADKVDAIRFAMFQFAVAAVLNAVAMIIFDDAAMSDVIACWIPVLYTGFLEVAAAYTLEIFGQKTTPPTIASIILALEGVFATLSGAVFLHEQMSGREIAGCIIMFIAILVTQLPGNDSEKKE